MRVCTVIATGILIEMQSDATEGTLIRNAVNGGYAVGDIQEQVMDAAQFATVLAAQPKP